jgi:hypothetical protein
MRESGWLSTASYIFAIRVVERHLLILLLQTVVDFYNQINLLYGSITEFCSPQSCPEMKATDEYVTLLPPIPTYAS